MAGLFSLGGGGGGGGGRGSSSNNQNPEQHHHHHNPNTEIPPPETLFWNYNKQNDDVSSYRGFELWNHHHHQQHQHQHQQENQLLHNIPFARPLLHRDLYSPIGVGPSRGSNINVSDDHSSSRSAFMGISSAVEGGSSGGGAGGISCQDCGNQAKKDCPHMRCRTCCKSRGYECQTHVKSTWVPASKRRERQQQQQQQLALLQQQEQQREISKRPRDIHNINNNNSNTSSALACTRLPSGIYISLSIYILFLSIYQSICCLVFVSFTYMMAQSEHSQFL